MKVTRLNYKKMKKRTNLLLIALFVITAIAFNKKKPKVLIIGDSISNGYTPFVRENLKEIAVVKHNPGNAQHTGKGLKNIVKWVEEEDWDVIQFNWGLWDLCYRHPDSKVQGKRDKQNGTLTFSVADYKKNLEAIVKKIKVHSDAKLVFVTTSYVPTQEAGRYTGDPLKYNEVARSVMEENGVLMNDIYEKSINIHKKYGKGVDDVHYTKKGYEKLSVIISEFLKEVIK